ncbi:MAG: hypothetical protein US53_C0005G0011, partial [Candidatus Woesebacteria bacterium GW2011_GWA1_37_7]
QIETPIPTTLATETVSEQGPVLEGSERGSLAPPDENITPLDRHDAYDRSPFERIELKPPEIALPQPAVPEPTIPGIFDSDGDGIPDRVDFDTDGDGQNDSHIEISQGKVIKEVLADGRELLLDPDSKGIPGLQYHLSQLHSDWSPKEVSIAATRAYAQGITADSSEISSFEKPMITTPLGISVKEIDAPDTDNDGKPDGVWKLDNQGRIVGGTTPDGNELLMATPETSKGLMGLQYEIANINREFSPDQVIDLAQEAFDKGISPSDHTALTGFINAEVEETFIPPVDPKTEISTNTINPEYQQPEINTENLVRGRGFDLDHDGKVDSWWLKDPETGKIVSGHLADGRNLVFGQEGVPIGIVQDHLANENPNLAPEQVGQIAEDTVEENNLELPSKTASDENNYPNLVKDNGLKVIESINLKIAQLSLQDYFEERFRLDQEHASEAARKVEFEKVRNEEIVRGAPGIKVLDDLNARIKIGESIYFWNSVNWYEWLKEQGLLN